MTVWWLWNVNARTGRWRRRGRWSTPARWWVLPRYVVCGKRLVGRKLFGVVDTTGLLLAVVAVAANVSDNAGGKTVMKRAKRKAPGLTKLWADDGFKRSFIETMVTLGINTKTVLVPKLNDFVVQPRRWVVERAFGWLVNNRRLRVDYERTVEAAEGFVYAAHTLMLLKRLTPQPNR